MLSSLCVIEKKDIGYSGKSGKHDTNTKLSAKQIVESFADNRNGFVTQKTSHHTDIRYTAQEKRKELASLFAGNRPFVQQQEKPDIQVRKIGPEKNRSLPCKLPNIERSIASQPKRKRFRSLSSSKRTKQTKRWKHEDKLNLVPSIVFIHFQYLP